ncbi:DUF6390 family protein [Candidatus Micrarchaeota archaeon]|nr:DUF6390 family protein [Candidatus Micrarchaeota archaeon]
MEGAELASLYAFPPNLRGYCGTCGFIRTLKGFRSGQAGTDALASGLKRFPAHYSYLSLIARESGLGPFDMEVVRAFWTGNQLLEAVRPIRLRRFIRRDLLGGKQALRARRMCELLPEGILPHHSFNVLYVNFVSNAVPRTIRNFDSCCITWGNVLSVSPGSLSVMRNSISYDCGFTIMRKKSKVALERDGLRFLDEVKKGDVVSVHWGMAVEKLSRKNERLLEEYTLKNIRAINESGAAAGWGR